MPVVVLFAAKFMKSLMRYRLRRRDILEATQPGYDAELKNLMDEQYNSDLREQLRSRLRQLILLRETGPKNAAWHAARMNLIWRIHDELKRASEETGIEERKLTGENTTPI